jgi:membrane protein YdbS with pleckstrin-like domain
MEESEKPDELMDHKIYIRGSVVLLFLRVLLLIVIFDTFYLLATILLNLTFDIPYEWHHHISLGLFIALGIQILIKSVVMYYLVLNWMSNTYILNSTHVVKKHGIFSNDEDIHRFDTVRSISIKQSVMGKFLNYGSILLKTSASGGFQDDIEIAEIDNPKRYEEHLKKCFS